MKRDLPSIITKCAKFLNSSNTLTAADIQKMCDHLDVHKMQRNPAVNLEPILGINEFKGKGVKFIRKGQIGDWRNYMTDDISDKFDRWIREKMSGSGLEFDFD